MKIPGKKALTATALAGAIGLGSLGVAALNPLGIAGAQDSGSTGTAQVQRHGKGAKFVDSTLQSLVQDGTITQDQATKIEQRLKERFQGGRAKVREFAKEAMQTAADTIGISPEQLRDQLKSGKSVAQVATDNNVEPQKVVDAIVAKVNAKIDQAVTDGKLTQEQADQMKSKAPQRVSELVDRTWGQRKGR